MTQLFDVPIHASSRWIFNCYVVEDAGDGRPLVVDAGLPCTAAGAAAILDRLSSERVLLASTHGHSDHVSGIPRLLERYDAQLWLPARCEAYLAGEPARTPGPREAVKIMPVLGDQPFDSEAAREFVSGASVGYGRGTTMRLPFPVKHFLSDGDALGADWEVVHAPGHTDDSTCLYHRDSETLIAGDAVLTHEGRAWLNPEVVDPRAATQTEERLRELNVRHLLPGHGYPLEGRHLLRDARAFTEQPPGRGWLAKMARSWGRW